MARVKPVSTIAKPAWKKNIRKPHKRTHTKLSPIFVFPTWAARSLSEAAAIEVSSVETSASLSGTSEDWLCVISAAFPVFAPEGSGTAASSANAIPEISRTTGMP